MTQAAGHRPGGGSEPAHPRVARWIAPVERALARSIEVLLAVLVAAEVLILSAGIVARYLVHRPLVWADEVASILFLWLAVLGTVVASMRSQHMRMTALIARLAPQRRQAAEVFAIVAATVFFAALLWPAIEFAQDSAFIITATLEVSGLWRGAALPVGFGLLLLASALRLLGLDRAGLRAAALALVVLAVIAGSLFLAKPLFAHIGNYSLLAFFVVALSAGVFAGVPIAAAFGLATVSYLAFATTTPLPVMVGRIDEGMSHLTLLAVPMFVVLGALLTLTNMAQYMVEFLARLVGRVRGGLNYVLVCAMYIVSGISGAKAADMAAVAPVLFPEMKARGERPGEMAALLAATGAQTETVPPSLVLITIGAATGVSIAGLFTGGLLPALILGILLCVLVWVRARSRVESATPAQRTASSALSTLSTGKVLLLALPTLLLPVLIRGAVIEGVATATEVSTIGIAYCVVVGALVYRQVDWRRIGPLLVEAGTLSGAILIIIGTATAMAWALTQSGFSHDLAEFMMSMPGGAVTFMAASIVLFIILGSILEGIPAIVLFGPILFPIAARLGIHQVQYAMVVILSMSLGLFSPPFGVGYYMACAIGKVSPDEGMRAIWGYMLALFIGVLVVAAVPWLSIGFL